MRNGTDEQASWRFGRRWCAARAGRVTATLAVLLALVSVASAHVTYRVQPGDTLSGIAAAVGSTVRALAEANRIADPDRLPAGVLLQVPGGTGGGPGGVHVVRPGETLSEVARRYGVSVAALAAANGIVDPNRVMAGTRLSVARDAPAIDPPAPTATHVVRPGETLSHLAARYGVSVADLAAANRLADPNRLQVGMTLTVPGGWRCPVAGPVRFINDFGLAKSDGRFHEGVDVFAERGTPVVAPVAGTVAQKRGGRGGLQVWLQADDGDVYFGSHLDAFGAAGRVSPGTRIGTVGTTGNAAGTRPHLHFEFHPGGGAPANPYPLLLAACG